MKRVCCNAPICRAGSSDMPPVGKWAPDNRSWMCRSIDICECPPDEKGVQILDCSYARAAQLLHKAEFVYGDYLELA